MNKSQLIETVAAGTGIAQATVKAVLNGSLDTIADVVSKGDEVQLSGFGKFERVNRVARSGVNSFTGKPFKTKAHGAPKFSPARDFKAAVR